MLSQRKPKLSRHIKLNPKNIAYYCKKQYKNIENSRIIEHNLILSLPFSLYTATCASCRLPQRHSFFISWTQCSANFKRHKWSFVPYIVSFSGLKMVFSKLSQLHITACVKNCLQYLQFTLIHVFNYTNIYTNFLLYKYFCTNPAWIRNSSTIFRSSHPRCSIKMLFWKILCYSQESTCAGVSFLLKLQAFRLLAVLKRDFRTDILLRILGNL